MTEEQLRQELQAVYGSMSWKITKPLRSLKALLGSKRRFRISLRMIFFNLARRSVHQPWLRKIGARGLMYFPSLRYRIRKFMVSFGAHPETKKHATYALPDNEAALSPDGLAILMELRLALRQAQR